jgi:dimethylargininase
MHPFTRAIARKPPKTFASGLTTSQLGTPVLSKVLAQHERYCEALARAGLEVVVLAEDSALPDSPFVEDVAVVAGSRAILTRPGAVSRRGETTAVREALARFFDAPDEIEAPGTIDGGDVCEAGERAFIGISQRTNRIGADQLATWFRAQGKVASIVDISDLPSILHLKSGMSYVGNDLFVVIGELAPRLGIADSSIVGVDEAEEYAANCVRVNGVVLVADGYSRLRRELDRRGLETQPLDVSEFRKMDGGLSCLSIRF